MGEGRYGYKGEKGGLVISGVTQEFLEPQPQECLQLEGQEEAGGAQAKTHLCTARDDTKEDLDTHRHNTRLCCSCCCWNCSCLNNSFRSHHQKQNQL